MTKEEFEKEFKVGDVGSVISHDNSYSPYKDEEIIRFTHIGFVTIDKNLTPTHWNYNEDGFTKVEPVKKWWKHVFLSDSGEIIIRYFNHNAVVGEYEYLKEPTEITLDELQN